MLQSTVRPYPWPNWGDWWLRNLRESYQQHRQRIRLQEIADLNKRDWRIRTPINPDIAAHAAFFTPSQIRLIISKWEADVGSPGAAPTPPPSLRDPARSWRLWPDVTQMKPHPAGAGAGAGAARDAPTVRWESAGHGLSLALVAAVLAVVLLLLRAADWCLHSNLFILPTRRQSEEWPIPNVMATSLAVRMTSDLSSTRPPSPQNTQSNEQVDLPPPYSECADGTAESSLKPEHEEPPPPYSACYVAYSNPKDRESSVHFLTRQCQNIFANYEAGPSSVHNTGQTQENIAPSHEDSSLTEDARVIGNEGGSEDEISSCEVVYTGSAENDYEVELRETIPSPQGHRDHLVV